MAMLYRLEVSGSVYFANAGDYVVEARVDKSRGTFVHGDPGYTVAENESLALGEAELVDVTVTVFRNVSGHRVPLQRHVYPYEVYGVVDDEHVSPVTHPHSSLLESVALETLIKELRK